METDLRLDLRPDLDRTWTGLGLRQPAAAFTPAACCGQRMKSQRIAANGNHFFPQPPRASRLAPGERQQAAALQVFP